MGYAHYWNRSRVIAPDLYRSIVEDFSRLVPEWGRLGVPLAGPLGHGRPTISNDEIAFNGRIRCRHAGQHEVTVIARLLTAASLLSMPGDVRGGLDLARGEEALAARRCPGCCAFEPFWFPQVHLEGARGARRAGRVWDRTVTAFRPYDLAVTSALLIARRHLGDELQLDSDGGQAQWWDARLLCQTVLGYGLTLRLGLRDE